MNTPHPFLDPGNNSPTVQRLLRDIYHTILKTLETIPPHNSEYFHTNVLWINYTTNPGPAYHAVIDKSNAITIGKNGSNKGVVLQNRGGIFVLEDASGKIVSYHQIPPIMVRLVREILPPKNPKPVLTYHHPPRDTSGEMVDG